MNDNKKIRAPKLAITKPMVDAGKAILDKMTSVADDFTDDALVAGIFYEMWAAYWTEVMAVQKKKATVHPFVKPTGLILRKGIKGTDPIWPTTILGQFEAAEADRVSRETTVD